MVCWLFSSIVKLSGLSIPLLFKSFASARLVWYVTTKSFKDWLSSSLGSVVALPDLNSSVLFPRLNSPTLPSLLSSQRIILSTSK